MRLPKICRDAASLATQFAARVDPKRASHVFVGMNIADLESQVSARKWRPLRAPLFLYGFGLVINAATNTASACDCAVSPPTAFTAPNVAEIVLEVEVADLAPSGLWQQDAL